MKLEDMLHEPDESEIYIRAAQALKDRGEIRTQEAIYREAFRMLNLDIDIKKKGD